MRSGHLLAEESPHNLLTLHGLESLEDVFLKLCMKDVSSRGGGAAGGSNVAPVVAVTNASKQQASNGGHDNPAFAQSFNNPDAVTSDMDHGDDRDDEHHHHHHQHVDGDDDHRNLAQLSIVSFVFPSSPLIATPASPPAPPPLFPLTIDCT